jgi:zinc protease
MPTLKYNAYDSSSRLPGLFGLLLLLAIFSFLRFAPSSQLGNQRLSELSSGRLDNGVHFVVQNRPSSDHRIVIALNMRVGAQDERPEESGISHYLEHMAFNGAGEFGAREIDTWLRSQGLTTGRDDNASTSYSETVYELSIPDNSPEAIRHALRFFAAVASQMHLDPAMIEKERPIILGEMQLRHTPDQEAVAAVKHFTSGGVTLDTPVIGTTQTVNSFHREQLADYYHRMYRPDRATVEVLGNVDANWITKEIQADFGNWTSSEQPVAHADNPAPTPESSNDFSVMTIPQIPRSYVILSRMETVDPGHPDEAFQNDLYSRLFSVILDHRFDTLRERGDLPGAHSSVGGSPILRQFFKNEIFLTVTPEHWRESLAGAWQEMRNLREQPVAASELDQAAVKVTRDLQNEVTRFETDTAGAREDQLRSALRSPDGVIDPSERLAWAKTALSTITPETLQKWVQQHAPNSGWRVAMVTPPPVSPQQAPEKTELASVIADAERAAVKPWREDAPITSLLPAPVPSSPGHVSSTTDSDLQVTTTQLPNHLNVHYRKMEACGNQVTFCVSLDGGEIEETADTRGITQLAVSALRSAATHHYTSLQMVDWLRTHGMTWDVSTDRNAVLLTLRAPSSEVDNAFRFLHVILTDTVLRPNVKETWQSDMGTTLNRCSHDPMMASIEQAELRLFGGDSRLSNIPVSQLDRLTDTQGREWLDHLVNHCYIEAGIVGNVPAEKMVDLTAQYLGSLADHPQARAEMRPLSGPLASGPILDQCAASGDRGAGTITFRSASLKNLQDFYGLQLISQIIQHRLFTEVREKMGMAYFINCQAEPGLTCDDGGFFLVSFSSSNEKVSAGVTACQNVLKDFVTHGATDSEIATALKQTLMSLQELKDSPEHWAWSLSQLQVNQNSLERLKQRSDDFLHAANSEEIMRLARKYLTPDREFTAIAKQGLSAE